MEHFFVIVPVEGVCFWLTSNFEYNIFGVGDESHQNLLMKDFLWQTLMIWSLMGKISFALDSYAITQQNIARPRNLRIMPEKSKNVYLKPEG